MQPIRHIYHTCSARFPRSHPHTHTPVSPAAIRTPTCKPRSWYADFLHHRLLLLLRLGLRFRSLLLLSIAPICWPRTTTPLLLLLLLLLLLRPAGSAVQQALLQLRHIQLLRATRRLLMLLVLLLVAVTPRRARPGPSHCRSLLRGSPPCCCHMRSTPTSRHQSCMHLQGAKQEPIAVSQSAS